MRAAALLVLVLAACSQASAEPQVTAVALTDPRDDTLAVLREAACDRQVRCGQANDRDSCLDDGAVRDPEGGWALERSDGCLEALDGAACGLSVEAACAEAPRSPRRR